eukprot:Skav221635  [mRNA]  locus=scaffold2627:305286:305714:+ [translate_table: standard]
MPSKLSLRLKNVQEPVTVGRKAPCEYALCELEEMKVTWGKVGRGSTFIHMWKNNQHWVSWTVSHYETSPDEDKALFIHFVGLMVDRLEMSGEKIKVPVKSTAKEEAQQDHDDDLQLEARLRRIEKALGLAPWTNAAKNLETQ